MHSVLEDCIKPDEKLDFEEIKILYNENKKSYDPSGLISSELISAGEQILEEFYDEYQDTIFDVYDKEYGFAIVLGSYLIVGYIDRLDLIGDDLVKIIDYKTGKWEVALKDVPTNLQLGIYALAASKAFPGKRIIAELHYLRSGRKKGHEYSEEDLEEVKSLIIESINNIIEDKSFHPTKNERACTYCDFAQNGVCSTGVFRMKKKAKA